MYQYFFKTVLLSIVVLLSLPVYGDDYTETPNNGEEPNTSVQTQDNGGADSTSSENPDNAEMHNDTSTVPTTPPPAAAPVPTSNANAPSTQPKEVSPEERAYQEKMLKISNAITQKITEIQKKQSEIDSELYPAYIPPLQAEKNDLNKQLQALEMQRDQYQAQKTAQDLQKQLNKP